MKGANNKETRRLRASHRLLRIVTKLAAPPRPPGDHLPDILAQLYSLSLTFAPPGLSLIFYPPGAEMGLPRMEGCRQLLLLLLCRREGVSQRGEGRAGAVCEDAEVIGRHFGAIYRSRKVGLRKKCHLSSSPARRRRRRPCGLASPNTSIASRPPPATAFPEFSPPAYLFTEKLIRRRYRPRRRTARPPSGTSSHLPTIFSNAMFKCDRQWEKGPKVF